MKIQFQFAILLLAAFFMRPILAENIQAPAPAGIEQTVPAMPDEQKGKENNRAEEPKKSSKKPPLPDIRKILQEPLDKKHGKPLGENF